MFDEAYGLSNTAKQSLDDVRQLLGATQHSNRYCTPYNILRWVYAYGDIKLAAKKIKRHLVVRRIRKLDDVTDVGEDDKIAKHSPITILDKRHSGDDMILVFELVGRMDFRNIIKTVGATNFLRSRFYTMERILKRINQQEKETSKMLGATFVIDLEGLQMHTDLLSFLSGPYRIMWGTLLEQYPGIFSKIILVNVPKFMNALWIVCEVFITKDYRDRIVVTTENWRQEILGHIDADYLPIYYGGVLVDENGDERCRQLIPFPVPYSKPKPALEFAHSMETITIPAGKNFVEVYYFEKNMFLDFYMHHKCEITMGIYYSKEMLQYKPDEEQLEEVYDSAERAALPTVDHWYWITPYTGHYYIFYGNTKAWFLPTTVNRLIVTKPRHHCGTVMRPVRCFD